ncbi:hypothetical protein BRADI_1g72910v3 [Brachypodium distachyon]|uniref:Major facilitator superfamily (MFS) profile domain-containing protein n=1 Tax=Brachypodium distachyon TaxID=15368 RepID=A0A2K2DUT8_BRADI|nr:hypothetical protein BRADI_1g72910v3 [Brachypodium distachyon]
MEASDDERPLLIHYQPPQDAGSQCTCDGTVDIDDQPATKKSTGNWRACFFILGAEVSEGICFFGVQKNLVTFLTSVLHESNVDAARSVSTWTGTCFFTPLIGAFLADTYLGRYLTVVTFLSVYVVGLLVMTFSASLPLLMPSSYSIDIQHVVVYLGLYLVALGTGGIKPCASSFGADQFDSADPVEQVAKGSFFNWYYFLINIGSVLSATLLVWVQDNIGWGVGFGILMVLMVFGLTVFVTALHGVPSLAGANCKTEHTNQFRFFDKAAIVLPPLDGKGSSVMSPWRLCTVSQVEELKTLLRLCPVWASLLFFFAVTGQMTSTLIEQGMAMDNRVGGFTVPPASLSTFDIITVVALIPLYDVFLVPLARRATGKNRGISQLQRIGTGLALSAAAMAYSALVETRRLAAAAGADQSAAAVAAPLSIMWQAPSYIVLGAAEVFASIGALEFFYDESPESMKSLGAALAQLAIAGGSYLNSALLGVVASATARGGAPGWIPDDLNQGHLDYFFWMMAGLSVLNLLHFMYCSMRYKG